MLNWLKFIVAFLLVLTTIITVVVLVNAVKPYSNAKEDAIEAVIKSGKLETVTSAEVFNGSQSCVTVYGVDKKNKEKAMFVNSKTNEVFNEISLADGITKSQALENVENEFEVKKVLHVTLGMEEEKPVWEIAFKSNNGKLNYVYLYFDSGDWWKRILNL